MGEVYIEFFTSPGCVKCPAVKKMLRDIVSELGGVGGVVEVEEVDILKEASRAAQYNVMAVPAIVVNGVPRFVGVVPRKDDLRRMLVEELKA